MDNTTEMKLFTPSYSHLKKLPNSQVMIIFAGSASNYNKISVFLAMIAKPWTLVCCNIHSISLHLFISLLATFPKYFRTFSSHYLRYFPNISAALYLIICATWATANRRKQAAGKEVSVERNIGKKWWKKVYRRKISPLPIFSHGDLSSSPQLLLSTSFF